MTSLSHGTGNACSQVKEGFSSYAIQCTITELSPVSSDQKPVGLCLMLLSRKWFPLVACSHEEKVTLLQSWILYNYVLGQSFQVA